MLGQKRGIHQTGPFDIYDIKISQDFHNPAAFSHTDIRRVSQTIDFRRSCHYIFQDFSQSPRYPFSWHYRCFANSRYSRVMPLTFFTDSLLSLDVTLYLMLRTPYSSRYSANFRFRLKVTASKNVGSASKTRILLLNHFRKFTWGNVTSYYKAETVTIPDVISS